MYTYDTPPRQPALTERKSSLERRVERYRNNIDNALEELARLEELAEAFPPEDPFEDEAVIFFRKSFGGMKYTYAAVRCNNGQWFTTGPRSPKYYTWAQLVDFLSVGVEIEDLYFATEWTPWEQA